MSTHGLLFAVTLLLATGLAWISVSAPRRLTVRLFALAITLLFLPLAHASLAELLGRPKPIGLDMLIRLGGTATVLASSLEENERIFLWLQLEHRPEPRAFQLPWNRTMAEQLQGASEEARRQAAALRMRLPYDASLDRSEPLFYVEPQEALPEKEPPPAPLAVHAG
jgi:hypothetical protein